jgi:hypothetical protein
VVVTPTTRRAGDRSTDAHHSTARSRPTVMSPECQWSRRFYTDNPTLSPQQNVQSEYVTGLKLLTDRRSARRCTLAVECGVDGHPISVDEAIGFVGHANDC